MKAPRHEENKYRLPRLEWDFELVPREELVACGFWEYARESKFIRQTYETCTEDPQAVREDVERIRSIGQPAEMWFEDGESIHRCGFFAPWRSLPTEVRDELAETIRYRPTAIAARTDVFVAKEICEADARFRKYAAKSSAKNREKVKRAALDRYRPCVHWAGGKESFIIDIAWEHYNDEELVQAFRKWIGEARPEHMNKPQRAGHQLRHWRVALRRLGIMRLNYYCTRNRLRSLYPEAWERFKDYYKEWYEAPGEALKFYNKLFPFAHGIFDDPIHFWPIRKGRKCIIYATSDGKFKFSP